jgi:hypothetical protein
MIHYFATLQPVDRLEIATDANMQWIRRSTGRVFTAQTERLKASWAFDVRSSVRLIVQNDHTDRAVPLYDVPVSARSGSLATSFLYQRRLNYATGVFVGVGDSRALDDTTLSWLPSQRSFFAKISYALAR